MPPKAATTKKIRRQTARPPPPKAETCVRCSRFHLSRSHAGRVPYFFWAGGKWGTCRFPRVLSPSGARKLAPSLSDIGLQQQQCPKSRTSAVATLLLMATDFINHQIIISKMWRADAGSFFLGCGRKKSGKVISRGGNGTFINSQESFLWPIEMITKIRADENKEFMIIFNRCGASSDQ